MEKQPDDFNSIAFEKKLSGLKDTQESIQSMSAWCLKQRSHHKKIVASWLNVLKRVKVEQRLVLFYLANDVIQYSKRKNYEFVESWGLNLQKATPLVRDEKVRHKILRIFKIWEQRSVYDEEFLSDLTGLLSAGAAKKAPDDDASDFQPQQLVNKIKQCSVLEADTDLRLKHIHESPLQLSDADALCATLKERRNMDEVDKELGDGIERVERYTAALQREIVAREALLALLASAHHYYGTQRGEVKVVAYAYKNFGARVRCLKRKLDERLPRLPARAELSPSPPRPGELVPSPEPDEDLQLPGPDDADTTSYNIDKTFSASISGDYGVGFSSFLGSENPFNFFQDATEGAGAGSKIEVISNAGGAVEKPDFNINDFLKNLTSETSTTELSTAGVSQKSVDTLPGLDLLTPESAGAPPQLSFYGSLDNSVQDDPEPYQNDPQWSNTPSSWSVPLFPASSMPLIVSPAPTPAPVPVPTPPVAPTVPLYADTPESPPPGARPAPAAVVVPEGRHYTQDMPPRDLDIRSLLPPPPPPPSLTMPHLDMEDVDHRQLPSLPVPAPPPASRHQAKDVDHRNLISLTAPPPAVRHVPGSVDQDYRVPPPMTVTDIVESVDMDLSDDEHGGARPTHARPDMMFQGNDRRFIQPPPSFDDGRNRNNKVLVGGDNGTRNHNHTPKDSRQSNLIRINSAPNDATHSRRPSADLFESMEKIHGPEPQSAPPVVKPLVNPFDAKPEFPLPQPNFPDNRKLMEVDFDNIDEAMQLMDSENSNDSAYSEDLRTRFLPEAREPVRNPSPPRDFLEEEWARYDNECSNPPAQNFRAPPFQNQMNPRFQRNWNPRPQGFRPPAFGQQFWPRNGPRPPNSRLPWMGQRPRFW